jgi:hypothetical protein
VVIKDGLIVDIVATLRDGGTEVIDIKIAMGKEPSVYIYHKNVNSFPTAK